MLIPQELQLSRNSHLLTFKYALPYSYGLEKSILRLLNHVRG